MEFTGRHLSGKYDFSVGKPIEFEVVEDKQKKRQVRPPCPECGSEYVWSRGTRWVCKKCGRYFVKIPRLKKINFKERPCCPECGAYHTISYGTDWQCGTCGRWWKKKPKKPITL